MENIKEIDIMKDSIKNYTKQFIEENSIEYDTIYKTKNYDMFKSIKSNRKLNPANYGKLFKSMREQQLVIPICVNEKYEIIDGQHRYAVCKDLGLSVYYFMVIGYNTKEMKKANLVSRNWTVEDFMHSYAADGNEDYIKFSQMQARFGINTTDLLKVIARLQEINFRGMCSEFNEGNFHISDEEERKVINFLVALEDFNFFKEYKDSKFVGAFISLYFFPSYSHEVMKKKLEMRAEALELQLSTGNYIKCLANKIYSYGATKYGIYYDSDRDRMYSLD